ncbi:UNVERIFIED_ORG: glycosyltransferase involved in cell wall biosynthesis [Shinella zoogloeoides]|nr:glycosyltransferase involved in cell wall biosynthesis [Shinella zoogloeoides]
MQIIVVSFYYPPDLSAGSFRTGALVQQLLRRIKPGDSIRVLTTIPNRYVSFQLQAAEIEMSGALTVERIAIPKHEGGFKDQILSFLGFAREVLRRVRGKRADVVYATSSRLGTASLGALVARRTGAKLHLDIRDLFAENMSNMLKGPVRFLLPFLRVVEKRTFGAADQISIVSPGFDAAIRAANPRVVPALRTNGIDEEFIGADFERAGNGLPLILYAGNIGDGQGLSRIIPQAAQALHGQYRFRIIGDGGRRNELEKELAARQHEAGHELDVEILAPMKRDALLEEYARADILLVHLNDYPSFRLVIPSKLFEYGATGKPILAGIKGVSADFATKYLHNAALFPPCDAEGMARALKSLRMGQTDRSEFVTRFTRSAILNQLADDILNLGRARCRQ